MGTRRRKFHETCVIYESAEDGCWVAHGVRTDQIGTGDCIVDALADYMRAIVEVLRVASKGKDITIYRLAPAKVRHLAKKAPMLPKEIYEIAHRKVFGTWPNDIAVKVDSQPKRPFKARVEELVPA